MLKSVLTIIAWALAVVVLAFVNFSGSVAHTSCEEETISEPIGTVRVDVGRIAGDDVPAREHAWPSTDEFEDQEDFENEKIEEALLAKANKLENVTVTHYCSCALCCGKDDGIGAGGTKVIPYETIAVDRKVIPLGSQVLVDYGDGEIHYYRATDTGVKGKHIDVCVTSHKEALNLGVKKATVWWIKED